MREHFEAQIAYYPELTEYILGHITFKTVWSGKRMQVGDKILYAYVYQLNTNNLKLISFLERELHELPSKFKFVKMGVDSTPILAFKDDTLKREVE